MNRKHVEVPLFTFVLRIIWDKSKFRWNSTILGEPKVVISWLLRTMFSRCSIPVVCLHPNLFLPQKIMIYHIYKSPRQYKRPRLIVCISICLWLIDFYKHALRLQVDTRGFKHWTAGFWRFSSLGYPVPHFIHCSTNVVHHCHESLLP